MDRMIVYPGAIPLDTDVLNVERFMMSAIGYLAQATLGTGTVVDGLACTQQTVPNMTVQIAPGSILSLATVDGTAFGSLLADTTDPLVKMGINPSTVQSTTLGTISAPGTTGQSINYLIQASFQESDATSVVLPYYNSANPAVPYSGPGNAGTPQNTQRIQRVNLGLKAGTPATTGTQVTPTPDSGFVGLWVVTVAFGQSSIVNANISVASGAPFIPTKLAQARGNNSQVFTSSGSWTCPAGVTLVKARVVGGGGGGGGGGATFAAAGGGAGGYSEGIVTVVPGTVYTITIGAGGNGGGNPGATGGTSSFASFMSATGGTGGSGTGAANSAGGTPGAGSGGTINENGGYGNDGNASSGTGAGGAGGASALGGGGRSGSGTGAGGQAHGSGGGGCYGATGSGGSGKSGIVILEW